MTIAEHLRAIADEFDALLSTLDADKPNKAAESDGALRERIKQLESQLPDGMKHCTIQFIECPVGHGRLTATNWVDHGCPSCEIKRLKQGKVSPPTQTAAGCTKAAPSQEGAGSATAAPGGEPKERTCVWTRHRTLTNVYVSACGSVTQYCTTSSSASLRRQDHRGNAMSNEHPLKGTQEAVSGAQEQEVKRWDCDCEHFYAEWHADKITVVRASDYDALNLLRKSTAHAMELRAREVEALREQLREAQRDAERYRWLFNHDDGKTSRVNQVWRAWDGESDWGDTIDAACSKEPQP